MRQSSGVGALVVSLPAFLLAFLVVLGLAADVTYAQQSLQEIIDNAPDDGSVIMVPPGAYSAINFNGKRITLRSEQGFVETIIDASDDGVVAVTMETSGGLRQGLEGFRIIGGAGSFGGGVYVAGAGDQVIADCVIENNTANFGGGIFIDDGSTVQVYNTLIVGNVATGFGSAVFSNLSDPLFASCTITGNTASAGSGVLFSVASDVEMTNSIVYQNAPSIIRGVNPQIRFSDIEGGWPGNNINVDPLFSNPKNGDYRPSMLSPCVDVGNNSDVPTGVVYDLRGNDRIVASDGKNLTVDLGAIEYQGVESGDPLPPVVEAAPEGSTIIVRPGIYEGPIDFEGRSITLQSTDGPESTMIVPPPKGPAGPLVLFQNDEGVDTILDGFSVVGGSATSGGAMLIDGSQPTILNCIFRNNEATFGGGAVAIQDGSPDIFNCVFIENRVAASDTGFIGGGAILNERSFPRITNCTFLDNDGVEQGGAIHSDVDSAPVIVNCLVRDNVPDQISGPVGQVSYSNVQGGGFNDPGNIDADPLITDEFGRLGFFSPCIDAGDTTAFPSNLSTDIVGRPRFHDDTGVEDTGKASPPIDIGAFEFQGRSVACPEDVNADLLIGFSDILEVLSHYGPCQGCVEDVDQNGDVGFSDILAILGAWGPCPDALGACCLEDGSCIASTQELCDGLQGDYRGVGTSCDTEQCPPP